MTGKTHDIPVAKALRRAGRDMAMLLVALAVLGAGAGLALRGTAGMWGALLGVGVAAVFSGTTVWSAWRTADCAPVVTGAVVMGAWVAKMVVLIVALIVLRGQHFYDRVVFAVVLLAGVVGSALTDYRAVARGRIPYVEPRDNPDNV